MADLAAPPRARVARTLERLAPRSARAVQLDRRSPARSVWLRTGARTGATCVVAGAHCWLGRGQPAAQGARGMAHAAKRSVLSGREVSFGSTCAGGRTDGVGG